MVLPLAVCALFLTAGCVNLPTFAPPKEGPPTGTVTNAHGIWENKVIFTPDPAQGGRSTPKIVGRLFLLSGDLPVQGNGMVQVELYEVSGLPPGQRPEKPLEMWRFDKQTLKRLLQRDDFGLWSYSIPLPWSHYRPDISQVLLVVSYIPEQGLPVYAPTARVSLNGTGERGLTVHQQQVPAGSTPRLLGPTVTGAPVRLDAPRTEAPTRIPLPTNRHSVFSKLVP